MERPPQQPSAPLPELGFSDRPAPRPPSSPAPPPASPPALPDLDYGDQPAAPPAVPASAPAPLPEIDLGGRPSAPVKPAAPPTRTLGARALPAPPRVRPSGLPEIDFGAPAAAAAPPALPARPPKPPKPPCAIHPAVESVWRCDRCKQPMCPVCEFAFPGNIRVCPECVTAPPPGVSGGRTGMAITGIVLAVIGMGLWGALTSGALGQHSEETVGQMFVWLILLPGLGSFAAGVSALDRRLGNNALLWISAALGSLLTVVLIGLVIIGNLSK